MLEALLEDSLRDSVLGNLVEGILVEDNLELGSVWGIVRRHHLDCNKTDLHPRRAHLHREAKSRLKEKYST